MKDTSILYWHPPVTLRLVFSLSLGMKGYLYTILVSSSNPEVSIFYPFIPTPKENTNLGVTGGCQYSIELSLHSYT
jgi:hypothetical protein